MILVPKISTRVNDEFIFDNSVNALPINKDIKHPLITGDANDQKTRYQADFYSKIALDIVTETVFNYPYPCITEKTVRPIAVKRMFIVLGPPKILSMLKSKGFETFSDIIDESYDDIIDPIKRFNAVIKSVESFVSLPIQDIKLYYYRNQQRFEHNYQTLVNLQHSEIVNICLKLKIPVNVAKLKKI